MIVGERILCLDCMRPQSACWCALVPSLRTRTRVLILQHPRERMVPIGTARMAHRALVDSTLRVGVDFSADPVVAEALRGPAVLLFPGPRAVDLDGFVAPSPLTLVVVDGTWANARKIVRRNPAIGALPQVGFTPSKPSEYRIRREPASYTVATIEALAHVLGRLEDDPTRFESLLVPFRAMVDAHARFRDEVGAHRQKSWSRRPLIPAWLAEAGPRLVLVHGEENASVGRRPGEIVHWLAVRLTTAERFEAVLRSRSSLAPTTPEHLELPRELIDDGESFASFGSRWRAFLRPDDVLASWRTTSVDALEHEGGAHCVPVAAPARIDLRPIASKLVRGRPGTVLDCAVRLGLSPAEPWARGRGGRRMAALETIARRLFREPPR